MSSILMLPLVIECYSLLVLDLVVCPSAQLTNKTAKINFQFCVLRFELRNSKFKTNKCSRVLALTSHGLVVIVVRVVLVNSIDHQPNQPGLDICQLLAGSLHSFLLGLSASHHEQHTVNSRSKHSR